MLFRLTVLSSNIVETNIQKSKTYHTTDSSPAQKLKKGRGRLVTLETRIFQHVTGNLVKMHRFQAFQGKLEEEYTISPKTMWKERPQHMENSTN